MIRIAMFALLATTSLALAHDDKHLSDWIGEHGYRSWDKVPCCGFKDCPVVKGVVPVTMPTVGFRLPGGEFVPLIEAMPSEDGNFYRCHDSSGKRRCFFYPNKMM